MLGDGVGNHALCKAPYEYDPDNPKELAPIRDGEKAMIPLDTKDPAFNLWQTPRTDLAEGRKPGLINIQRFN